MKTTAYLTTLAIAALAVPALAGPLTPVACDPAAALSARPLYVTTFNFSEGTPGLVSKQAMVGSCSGNGWAFSLAIDCSQAGASAPDVVRFDFAGKGTFAGAPTAPLKLASSRVQGVYTGTFGPTVVKAAINGSTIPVTVSGQYMKSGSIRRMELTLGTALEGKCRFGDRELAVRIVDGDNNMKPGNPWQKRAFGKNVAIVPGDTILVDLGDGSLTKDVRKACYGSPIEVGGKWYQIAASADGKQVAATAVQIAGGKLRVDHPAWSAMLMGDKFVLPLDGDTQLVSVPAGEYELRSYAESSAPNAAGQRASLGVAIVPGPGAKVTVEAGKTTELAIGSPINAKVRVSKNGQDIIFTLVLTDAGGRPITSLTTYGGQTPPKPTIIITDAAGKQVYQNSLEYG